MPLSYINQIILSNSIYYHPHPLHLAFLRPKCHWAHLHAPPSTQPEILPPLLLRIHPNDHLLYHNPLIFHTFISRVANHIPSTSLQNSRLSSWTVKLTLVSRSKNSRPLYFSRSSASDTQPFFFSDSSSYHNIALCTQSLQVLTLLCCCFC